MADGMEIDEAVIAKLQADSGPGSLAVLAPGGVNPDVAPEAAADLGVFVIVSLQAHEDVNEQPGRTAFETPRYLVKAVARDTDAAGAIAAYRRVHAVLQHQALTISGFHWMDTVRESRLRFTEKDGALYWRHVGGIYRVEADPS